MRQAFLPSVFSVLHLEDAALWTKSGTAVPSVVGQVLSPFQQVLVVQAIYPDKLINILAQFLTRTLGKNRKRHVVSYNLLIELRPLFFGIWLD